MMGNRETKKLWFCKISNNDETDIPTGETQWPNKKKEKPTSSRNGGGNEVFNHYVNNSNNFSLPNVL